MVEYPGTDGRVVSFVGAHMDVVTANPDTWAFDPFKLTRDGDKIQVGGGAVIGVGGGRRARAARSLAAGATPAAAEARLGAPPPAALSRGRGLLQGCWVGSWAQWERGTGPAAAAAALLVPPCLLPRFKPRPGPTPARRGPRRRAAASPTAWATLRW